MPDTSWIFVPMLGDKAATLAFLRQGVRKRGTQRGDFGGATPLRISDLDGLTETDWALFSYRVNTFPGFWLNPMNNRQRQFNIVDTRDAD